MDGDGVEGFARKRGVQFLPKGGPVADSSRTTAAIRSCQASTSATLARGSALPPGSLQIS
jgi:hypothetical protein